MPTNKDICMRCNAKNIPMKLCAVRDDLEDIVRVYLDKVRHSPLISSLFVGTFTIVPTLDKEARYSERLYVSVDSSELQSHGQYIRADG